ncbi:MAG: hypothetical protein ACI976_002832 [Aureispira sp.]
MDSILAISSCEKCTNEQPRARIENNGTNKASVQIQTSGGNTVNSNNILTGTVSEYSSYAAGDITFTVSVDQSTAVLTVPMLECYEYDIKIDGNNDITSVPNDRNEK